MTALRNSFIDPAGNRSTYDWTINHLEEESFGKARNVTSGANTANVGLVQQQGPGDALTLRYTGTILTQAQLLEMWAWYNLSEDQTIHFQDFAGNVYEVTITSFQPLRKAVARNMSDPTNAPRNIWTYSIEMRVLGVLSGPLASVL